MIEPFKRGFIMTKNTKKLTLSLLFTFIIVISFLLFEIPLIFGRKDEETALAEALIQSSSDNIEEKLTISNGNSLISSANPANPDPKVVKKINMVLTAYSSTVLETDESPFSTASGSIVRDGVAANNLLPFGTKIRIPEIYGDKVFTIEDRMNSKAGNYHVDIWEDSYQDALNFGAKKTYIEVLE
jgi:3D (Asp-Asp-Asp) domain-containing protein